MAEDQILVSQDGNSAPAHLLALRTGQLCLRVESSSDPVNWISQPIDVLGNGLAIVVAVWGTDKTRIQVNGRNLLDASSSTEVHAVETRDLEADPVASWEQPSKDDACSVWTSWRATRFATSKQAPRQGRRLKSTEEQVDELKRAAQSATDLANLILQGHTHLLGHLATELRALLFWQGRQYDPLLLRLAARKNLSLPVFIVRDGGPIPVTGGLVAEIGRGMPSHMRFLPTHTLADLQEWLISPAVTEPSSRTGGSVGDPLRRMSVIAMIAGVADTLGAAHYDQDTPTALDILRSLRGPNGSEIIVALVEAARIVVPLCLRVANELAAAPPNSR